MKKRKKSEQGKKGQREMVRKPKEKETKNSKGRKKSRGVIRVESKWDWRKESSLHLNLREPGSEASRGTAAHAVIVSWHFKALT